MLVDLLRNGLEGSEKALRQGLKRSRNVVLATHGPIAHLLGEPCIHLFPKPKWHRYPLVHSRNIIPVLIHESLHCSLQRLLGFDSAADGDLMLDAIAPTLSDMRRVF